MADSTSAEDGKFRVESRVEILYILRALLKANAVVTAYFDGGREFVVSAVLQVNGEQGFVLLDSSANRELNERLLRSSGISAVSSQDGVRVQFSVEHVEAVSFEGRLALRIPLPQAVVKLQRREYYRVATPVLRPVKCEISGADGNRYELNLADISLGGVCLVGQAAGLTLEPGMTFENCRIVLPEVGSIQAGLCVRNTYTVPLKNGVVSHRTGCQFVKLGAQQEAMVQRYIIRLERERRAKQLETR